MADQPRESAGGCTREDSRIGEEKQRFSESRTRQGQQGDLRASLVSRRGGSRRTGSVPPIEIVADKLLKCAELEFAGSRCSGGSSAAALALISVQEPLFSSRNAGRREARLRRWLRSRFRGSRPRHRPGQAR
jgi:hypothetical protein